MAGNFAGGFDTGRGGPSLSPGLEAQSEKWNSSARNNLGRPTSVLSQIGLSPVANNASAPDMSDRYNAFTGQVMPNVATGSSAESAETAMKLRFAGQDEA
jgi:hypothetical protein